MHRSVGTARSMSVRQLAGPTGCSPRHEASANDSVFPGPVYSGYGRAIATATYTPPGFTSSLGLKDLRLALGIVENLGFELPTGTVLQGIFEEAIEHVGGDLDWASVAEVTRRRAGGTGQAVTTRSVQW